MSKLGEICKISSSKRIFENEYQESGVPFIRGQEISDGSLLSNSCFNCYISKDRFNEIKNKYGVPKKGDILITAVGTIGNVCFLNKDIDFYFKDGNVLWLKNFSDNVVPEYLYFYLKSPFFKKTIGHSLIGAVQKALTMQMLSEIDIQLPPIKYQKSVVTILKSIEDKISNNNKINAELESLAKTIYDYWFLQFEFPNEEGKPYKSSGGKMVWNEELKRKIPEGWASENFGKLFSSQAGFAFKSTDWVEKGFPVLTIKSIQNNCQVDMSQASFISNFEDKHLKYKVRNGNIIFAMSGNTIGKIGVIASKESNIFINQRVLIIKTTSEDLAYIYFLFNDKAMQNNIKQKGANSAQPNISEESLRAIKVCIPQEAILNKYNKLW